MYVCDTSNVAHAFLSPLQRGVWALCFYGRNHLISGAHDCTIKVRTYVRMYTHVCTVCTMCVHTLHTLEGHLYTHVRMYVQCVYIQYIHWKVTCTHMYVRTVCVHTVHMPKGDLYTHVWYVQHIILEMYLSSKFVNCFILAEKEISFHKVIHPTIVQVLSHAYSHPKMSAKKAHLGNLRI